MHSHRDGATVGPEKIETKADLGRVLDALPGLVWTSTADGHADFLNRRWLEYTGLTDEEARGTGWQAALHPDDAPAALEIWCERVAAGVPGDVEARLRRFDGVYRWFQFRFAPATDAAGRIIQWCGINTDIEDVKRAQVERDMKLVIDTTPALIWSANAEGVTTAMNQHFREYVGPTDELGRIGWSIAVHPEDQRKLADSWREIWAAGAKGQCEARLRRHDGQFRWFLLKTSPLRDESGKIIRWHGVNTDIEDRKRIEAELHRLNSLLNHAQRITHVGSFWTDVGADEHFWSDEAYRIFELDPATARISIGTVRQHIHPDDVARYDALAAASPSIDGYEWDFRIVPKSGVAKYLRTSAHRATEITDRLVYFGTIQDVTEFRIAEDALRQSEAFLAEGEAVSGTGSFLWRLESGEITWSNQLYRIFEFEHGSSVTLERIGERVHPEDRRQMAEMVQRAHSAHDSEYEYRLFMPDGRIKNLVFIARFERDRNRRPQYRGIVQDVTERRLSEQALSRVRSELAHVSRVTSLNTLTASIAHEVNQPLAGIITNASTCLRKLGAERLDLDGARLTLERLIRDANRAGDVIARLRALFSKKEASIEPVDLNKAASEVIALSLSELRRNEISVRFQLDDNLPSVIGDRVQLQQVILNFTLNAMDAMCAVFDRPRHLLIASGLDQNGHVQLAVSDTGVGFNGANAAGLFDAFYTTKPGGMGIGLSVSRSIIESHHGRLWAKLNEGPGATFLFSIPPVPVQQVNKHVISKGAPTL